MPGMANTLANIADLPTKFVKEKTNSIVQYRPKAISHA
jgi:hypothetical protein